MADLEVLAGPFFYERGAGTLYAKDTDEIFDATGCKCGMRERGNYNGKRGLTISGPASNVSIAKEMAEKTIQQNQSGPPIDAQKGGADKRNENQARHADAERKRAQYKAPTTCKRKREDGQGWEGRTWSGYSNWVGDEWSRYYAGTPTQSDADAKWQTDAVPTTHAMTDHAYSQWCQNEAAAHHWAKVYWVIMMELSKLGKFTIKARKAVTRAGPISAGSKNQQCSKRNHHQRSHKHRQPRQ